MIYFLSVAPMETSENVQKQYKRGQSAHHSKHKKSNNPEVKQEDDKSPPDPLENWSTAGLVSMNSLLSWDNESDEY